MNLYLANVGLQQLHLRHFDDGALVEMPPLSQVAIVKNAQEQYTISNAVAFYAALGASDASALTKGIVAGPVTSAEAIDIAGYVAFIGTINPLYSGRLQTALTEQGSAMMPEPRMVAVPNAWLLPGAA